MRKSKNRLQHQAKPRGEWAELQFMARAAGMGFRIAKPLGDSYRWDVVVEHEFGFHRVQIKCTSRLKDNGYICASHCGDNRAYTPRDVDFLAIYVIPEDTWYIIPIAAVTGIHVFLHPNPSRGSGKYAQYREAWDLLRQPGRFDIQACADVRWADPDQLVSGFTPALLAPEDAGFSR